jgi:WbqC-like protein family
VTQRTSVAQRTLVAQQPTYLPYLGLLHKIARSDVFIVQDDLRYVKDSVSNRNRIRDGDGWKWLTIPVHRDNSSTFATVTPADDTWVRTHRRLLDNAYARAPHVDRFAELHELNQANRSEPLAVINLATIEWMLRLFEIDAEVVVESDLALPEFDNPNDRLISLSAHYACHRYLSGVGGHAYIELERWSCSPVQLDWSDFEPTPYPRGPLPWIPNLSAVDAIAWVDDLPGLLR